MTFLVAAACGPHHGPRRSAPLRRPRPVARWKRHDGSGEWTPIPDRRVEGVRILPERRFRQSVRMPPTIPTKASVKEPELRIGTSGWHYADWWGKFYPA